jgi:hypothetical protein
MAQRACAISLVSRDIIADSIETVCGAQYYDGLIAVVGCDKNMPGSLDRHGPIKSPGDHGLWRIHCRGTL